MIDLQSTQINPSTLPTTCDVEGTPSGSSTENPPLLEHEISQKNIKNIEGFISFKHSYRLQLDGSKSRYSFVYFCVVV